MKHKVTLSGSGHTFDCDESQNVLAAGLEAGYMLPYNCRSGFCRTCKSKILTGTVSYADKPMSHYLTADEHVAGFALLCQANPRADLTVETDEILGAEHLRPRETPCRIVAMERLTNDVMLVRLRLPMNENVRYFPGQHLSFDLGAGVRREYSMAGASRPEGVTEFELHVRHTPGGLFTDKLFNQTKLRALMHIEAPLGTFFLRSDRDNNVIMMATGTGFAPIKAMIEHAISTGEINRRNFQFYWGGRSEEDLYMADVVRGWDEMHPGFQFIPVLSRPPSDGAGAVRVGYVQDQVLRDHPDLSGFDVYACGSPGMIADADQRFTALGARAPAHFYMDEFLTAADRAVFAQKALTEESA